MPTNENGSISAAGMPSIHGGLAGDLDDNGIGALAQDPWADWAATYDATVGQEGPVDMTMLFPDETAAYAPDYTYYLPGDTTGGGLAPPADITTPAATGTVQDPSAWLTQFGRPSDATPGDPGYDPYGNWHYKNGDIVYSNGFTYYASDGTTVDPSGNEVAGGVSQSTAKAASSTGGSGWMEMLAKLASGTPIASAIQSIFHTTPSAPAGTRVGQVFRASDGKYYRLNANGSATLVTSPGLFGATAGGSGMGIVLLGGAALLLLGSKKKA